MPQRLARPVYEALPLLWALAGLGCLGGSYAWRASGVSGPLGLVGLVLLVLAIAVWMHRRDYRATAADYRLRGQPMPVPVAAPGERPAADSDGDMQDPGDPAQGADR